MKFFNLHRLYMLQNMVMNCEKVWMWKCLGVAALHVLSRSSSPETEQNDKNTSYGNRKLRFMQNFSRISLQHQLLGHLLVVKRLNLFSFFRYQTKYTTLCARQMWYHGGGGGTFCSYYYKFLFNYVKWGKWITRSEPPPSLPLHPSYGHHANHGTKLGIALPFGTSPLHLSGSRIELTDAGFYVV